MKCHFSCVNCEDVFQPTLMAVIPRIGEMLFLEGQKPVYRVIDVQYQFKQCGEHYEDTEFVLVNVVLKKQRK
jgi:hypothetical protein